MNEVGQVFNPFKIFVGSWIPNGLLRYQGVSSSAKLVWARLAQYAGENGQAYPKQITLANEIGVSRRTVQVCIGELVRDGFLKVIKPKLDARIGESPDRYEFLYHSCFLGGEHHQAQKLRTRGAETAHHINNVVEENQLRESSPLNPPKGGASASGQPPKDQSNGNDLVSPGEISDFLKQLSSKIASKSLIPPGLNGRSAPPP